MVVDFAKGKSHEGERELVENGTRIYQKEKSRGSEQARSCETVRGRERGRGRRGAGARWQREKRDAAGRRAGEPEFAQEAMKYVTGMMDVSA